MKHLVLVAFNLKKAESDDYQAIREELREMGLAEEVKNERDVSFELPDTTYLGVIDSPSTKQLKDRVLSSLQRVLREKRIRATYVISISKEYSVTMGRSN